MSINIYIHIYVCIIAREIYRSINLSLYSYKYIYINIYVEIYHLFLALSLYPFHIWNSAWHTVSTIEIMAVIIFVIFVTEVVPETELST